MRSGAVLAVVTFCLAVIRLSCSSNGVGTITIHTSKPAGKVVQPGPIAAPIP
ncbi:hypothetical protein V5E97_08925 [Singulisphaera sp. Ch08]|uniref:Uncharacterized protein n=1 Tax=Singulisphaera sp. Ch08 TaxID=3120278 RepID=A0AAU7CL36_9BACT